MQLFDAGQTAGPAVIAVGQGAVGLIAIGQMAHGVIAIGQVAVGVVALGQGSFGVFTLGMGSMGLGYCAAMLGIGGRGFGGVLPLVPSLGRHTPPGEVRPVDERLRAEAPGWSEAQLSPMGLTLDDRPLDLPVDLRLQQAVDSHEPGGVYLHLDRIGESWVITRLMERPSSRLTQPSWWLRWLVQVVLLFVLAQAVWALCVEPFLSLLLGRPSPLLLTL